ncbi:MAG: HAMP domain-containing histidine kinase [Rhodospirillales bacterium]|nr:HAMP domain-containing histidine kinase [Rhodospirillales bacterium]
MLTIIFIMVGEVLIYVPSVARFRKNYLEEHVAAARLAAIPMELLPTRSVTEELRTRLLVQSESYNIVLRKPSSSIFIHGPGEIPLVTETFDLRHANFVTWIMDAARALSRLDNRVIRVIGTAPETDDISVEVLLDEKPMRIAMWEFSVRILLLSIVISVTTAAFVFIALRALMVRPMGRLIESMTAFRANPENEDADIGWTERADEFGTAQRELGVMQRELRQALRQRQRLAALGSAVAKINHDLRNSLGTAMLVSDRLATSEDPDVKRVLPRLFAAIDRAVNLCSQTLDFASQDSPKLSLTIFPLHDLISEIGSSIAGSDGDHRTAKWKNHVDRGQMIKADRDQLFRAIMNVGRNAYQAGAKTVSVSFRRDNDRLCIEVEDDGPGLPDKARKNLFTPFMSSARRGGTGLGLVITRDVMRAHGGDVSLMGTGEGGTKFCLELPEEVQEGARFWI